MITAVFYSILELLRQELRGISFGISATQAVVDCASGVWRAGAGVEDLCHPFAHLPGFVIGWLEIAARLNPAGLVRRCLAAECRPARPNGALMMFARTGGILSAGARPKDGRKQKTTDRLTVAEHVSTGQSCVGMESTRSTASADCPKRAAAQVCGGDGEYTFNDPAAGGNKTTRHLPSQTVAATRGSRRLAGTRERTGKKRTERPMTQPALYDASLPLLQT